MPPSNNRRQHGSNDNNHRPSANGRRRKEEKKVGGKRVQEREALRKRVIDEAPAIGMYVYDSFNASLIVCTQRQRFSNRI